MTTQRLRSGRASRRRERGAVLVELTIVAPFLLLIVLGVMELGLRTQSSQTIVDGSRAAARVASSVGDDRLADYSALQALAGALDGYDPADIQRIIIFKSDTSDGALPPNCDVGPVADLCNHYDASDLNAPASDFATAGPNCHGSSPDADWCPLDRQSDLVVGADWLGVQIQVRHSSYAPFLADTTLTETTVMRLEPRFD